MYVFFSIHFNVCINISNIVDIESVEGLKKHLIENVGKKTIVAEMSNTDKVLELDHLVIFIFFPYFFIDFFIFNFF